MIRKILALIAVALYNLCAVASRRATSNSLATASKNLREPEADDSKLELSLQQREATARIAKLDIEKQVLALQLSSQYRRNELFKTLAGVGGFLTAIAAIGTLAFTTWKFQNEASETRDVRIEERFDRALDSLSRESASSRLAGVVSLKSFLTSENRQRHSRVLLSLSHALAIESDPIVRDAIVEVLTRMDNIIVGKETLDESLDAVVELNRGLTREGDLIRSHESADSYPKSDSIEARARSNAAVIVALMKKGGRTQNMSRIYCVGCDFSQLDLTSVDLSGSSLESCNFNKSVLVDASFDYADLTNATFIEANLQRARLRYLNWRIINILNAKDFQHSQLEKVDFPSFVCANLEKADFSLSLLGFLSYTSSTKKDGSWSFSQTESATNLRHSNLRGANFDQANVVFLTNRNYTSVVLAGSHSTWGLEPNSNGERTQNEDNLIQVFKYALGGANWEQALFSERFKEILKNNVTPPERNCSSAH